MKKIFLLIAFTIVSITFAQNPVVELADGSEDGLTTGYYLKDIYDYLDPFEGTYIYTTSGFTFKIVLVKKEMQYNGEYYEDLIIGEYEYTDGFNDVSTLNELNTVYNYQYKHNICGNELISNNDRTYPCLNCLVYEKRLILGLYDVNAGRMADMVLRKTTNIAGQEIIQVKVRTTDDSYKYNAMPFSLPSGTFTMIKQ